MAYSREHKMALVDKACEIVATTSRGLVSICKELGVSHSVFREWIATDDEISDKYIKAKEKQAHLLVDEIIEISDDSSNDAIVGPDGVKLNAEFVARSRLRVDTRKWLASKLYPKIYGDKLQTELTGANGGPLLVVNRIAPAPENDPL